MAYTAAKESCLRTMYEFFDSRCRQNMTALASLSLILLKIFLFVQSMTCFMHYTHHSDLNRKLCQLYSGRGPKAGWFAGKPAEALQAAGGQSLAIGAGSPLARTGSAL